MIAVPIPVAASHEPMLGSTLVHSANMLGIIQKATCTKKYKYLPIEPHIKSLYLTDCYAKVLCYCSLPRDSKIEDVFNGIHYRMLCQTQVMINGAGLDHHFFSDIQDVTLGLMLDRFQIQSTEGQ